MQAGMGATMSAQPYGEKGGAVGIDMGRGI